MVKDAYYVNYNNGKIYRDHLGYVQWQTRKGEWKRSARFKVADLAHFPFIQIKAEKIIGGAQ